MKKLNKCIPIPLDRKIELNDLITDECGYYNIAYSPESYQPFMKPQQLIILSEDKIKIDDWYLDDANQIRQCFIESDEYWVSRQDYKKIIGAYPSIKGVPTLDIEFIKEWCKNPVNEIEVDCNEEEIFSHHIAKIAIYKGTGKFLPFLCDNKLICFIPKQETKNGINIPGGMNEQLGVPPDKFNIVKREFDQEKWDKDFKFWFNYFREFLKEQLEIHFTEEYLKEQYDIWLKTKK